MAREYAGCVKGCEAAIEAGYLLPRFQGGGRSVHRGGQRHQQGYRAAARRAGRDRRDPAGGVLRRLARLPL